MGQNRPNVVRLVFDLKEEIRPQVFTLAPVGNYKHRLIFDLYPVKPVDPIAQMIEKGEWSNGDAPPPKPSELVAKSQATEAAALAADAASAPPATGGASAAGTGANSAANPATNSAATSAAVAGAIAAAKPPASGSAATPAHFMPYLAILFFVVL